MVEWEAEKYPSVVLGKEHGKSNWKKQLPLLWKKEEQNVIAILSGGQSKKIYIVGILKEKKKKP